jgi:hypothetical protein
MQKWIRLFRDDGSVKIFTQFDGQGDDLNRATGIFSCRFFN